jgi:pSer/pThr/pTyr-binding forkhead associated (FHA) protein
MAFESNSEPSISASLRANQASFLINIYAKNAGLTPLLSRRLLSLHPNEEAILGRISKNQKTEFLAKCTNGYFDNPIISRRHAVLANRNNQVVIIDQHSTHGTYLNAEKLKPMEPAAVHNMDIITLGCRLPTKSTVSDIEIEHLPTTLEVSIVVLPYSAEAARESRSMSTNSYHAPETDSEDELLPQPRVWRPFAQVFREGIVDSLPIPPITEKEAGHPAEINMEKSSDEQVSDVGRPGIVDLTVSCDAWSDPVVVDVTTQPTMAHKIAEDIHDEIDQSDAEVEHGFVPYHYDTDDKEEINGETQVVETPFQGDAGKLSWSLKSPMQLNHNFDEVVEDSFDFVSKYLGEDIADLIDEEDDSEYDEEYSLYSVSSDEISEELDEMSQLDANSEEIEESLESEVEEQVEEAEEESQEDYHLDDPWIISPVSARPATPPTERFENNEKPTETREVISTPPAPIVTQSQTPPITPDQLTRKRPLTPSSPLESPYQPSDPNRIILPLPRRRSPERERSPDLEILAEIQRRQAELQLAREEFESSKRRKVEGGWISTVGKYTVAGMVGSIATFVGLTAAAMSRQS